MDKWTWIGFLVTAVIALVGFVLLKSALGFILENWPFVLVGLLMVAVIAYLFIKNE